MPLKVDIKWVDSDGFEHGFLRANGKPRVSSTPYLYDIAEGLIKDHCCWMKLGHNPEISTDEEALWVVGGAYVFPTAGMGMEVVSSSVEDDIMTGVPAAGTGAHKVRIYYLDSNYEEQTEEVTLDGQGVVATAATNILRINGVRVTEAGTGGCAAGTIDVRHLANTPIYTRIAIGQTRARTAVYTVPIKKTLYITSIFVSGLSGASKNMTFTLRANVDDRTGEKGSIFFPYAEIGVEDASANKTLEIPIRLPAMSDVVMVGKGSGATVCSCALRGWSEE